jgi:hypothetical protein
MTREELQKLLDAHFEGTLDPQAMDALRAELAKHPDLEAECTLWENLGELTVEQPSPGLALRLAETLEAAKREQRASLANQPSTWLERALLAVWPAQPAYGFAIAAFCLVVGLAGGWLAAGGLRGEDPLLRELRAEVQDTRELVVLTMLQQDAATDRLRAVGYSSQLRRVNPSVISALVRTMRFDASVDVRLAAIEVLSQYRDQILVRQAFLDTAQDPQTNPLVQVELVMQLGQISDPAARLALEQMAVDDRLDRTVRLAAAQQVQASL